MIYFRLLLSTTCHLTILSVLTFIHCIAVNNLEGFARITLLIKIRDKISWIADQKVKQILVIIFFYLNFISSIPWTTSQILQFPMKIQQFRWDSKVNIQTFLCKVCLNYNLERKRINMHNFRYTWSCKRNYETAGTMKNCEFYSGENFVFSSPASLCKSVGWLTGEGTDTLHIFNNTSAGKKHN